MKFDDRILLYELSLNDTDDQVIAYIKANKMQVVNQSIQKTAEQLYTVPNTIVRLAKKLGYRSFSEMKFELRQELANVTEQKSNTQSKESLASTQVPKSISMTLQLIEQNHINKVAQLICDSKDILLLGVGDTSNVCDMFIRNLHCIGIHAQYSPHRHDMLFQAKQLSSKSICIAISARGENQDIIEATKIGKEKGATIVSLTHFYKNTLSSYGDINLYFWAQYQELNGYNITDRLGLMLLIRMLNEACWSYMKN